MSDYPPSLSFCNFLSQRRSQGGSLRSSLSRALSQLPRVTVARCYKQNHWMQKVNSTRKSSDLSSRLLFGALMHGSSFCATSWGGGMIVMQFSRAAAAALELILSRFWIRRQSGSVGMMPNCQTVLPTSYCRNHMTAQLASCLLGEECRFLVSVLVGVVVRIDLDLEFLRAHQ